MTIVLRYRDGKTEIVSFRRDTLAFPAAVRLRVQDEQRRFYLSRILRSGNPVYLEEVALPESAA